MDFQAYHEICRVTSPSPSYVDRRDLSRRSTYLASPDASSPLRGKSFSRVKSKITQLESPIDLTRGFFESSCESQRMTPDTIHAGRSEISRLRPSQLAPVDSPRIFRLESSASSTEISRPSTTYLAPVDSCRRFRYESHSRFSGL